MIRILQVVGGLSPGGTEGAVMNLYRHIDRQKVQFDFVSHHPENKLFEEEIKILGGRVYYVPAFNGFNYVKYKRSWENLLISVNDVNIIHSHIWSTAAIFLKIAKKQGLFTIAHSHSVSAGTGLAAIGRSFFIKPLRCIPDYYMACTAKAGQWLFGDQIVQKENFSVIPNALDVETYRYDKVVREQIRQSHNAGDKFVIGHVGSFNSNKNQSFILEVFSKVHAKYPKTVLWLIGTGETMDVIKVKAEVLGLKDSIDFMGLRNDVPSLLQAMDVFLFPSKHESFGSAALEAEAAGVQTICSDCVPEGVTLSEITTRLPLEMQDLWGQKICSIIDHPVEHKDMLLQLEGTSLDIKATSKRLEDFYINISERYSGQK